MKPRTTPFRRRIAMTAVTVAASALLAACASSGSSPTSANGTNAAATSSGAASSAPGVSQAAATVAKYENAVAFTPAGKPLSGVKGALAGKSIYYIPITQQVPIFPVIESGLGQALSVVGAQLHVCDGGATPSTTSACLNQAIAAHAAAVITDSIPYGFAQQGFAALQAHGIPILIGDEPSIGPNGPVAGNDKLAFLESNQTRVMSVSAD